jgi:hypothetical protein
MQGNSAVRIFSESIPQCTLGNTGSIKGKDVYPGYVALCEDGVNNTSTDCNGPLGRSDVLYFEPIGIGANGYTDIQVTICSSNTEPAGIVNGDQDNKQPAACLGAGGILAHATTLAFAENTRVVMMMGNKFEQDGTTDFTAPDKMPGGIFDTKGKGVSYVFSETPEPSTWVLLISGAAFGFSLRRSRI